MKIKRRSKKKKKKPGRNPNIRQASYVYIKSTNGDSSASMPVYGMSPDQVRSILAMALPEHAFRKHLRAL